MDWEWNAASYNILIGIIPLFIKGKCMKLSFSLLYSIFFFSMWGWMRKNIELLRKDRGIVERYVEEKWINRPYNVYKGLQLIYRRISMGKCNEYVFNYVKLWNVCIKQIKSDWKKTRKKKHKKGGWALYMPLRTHHTIYIYVKI